MRPKSINYTKVKCLQLDIIVTRTEIEKIANNIEQTPRPNLILATRKCGFIGYKRDFFSGVLSLKTHSQKPSQKKSAVSQ